MTTSKVISELVFAVFLLTTAISFTSAEGGSKICTEWRGVYRDCLCREQRRDHERLCHDAKTYYEPEIIQEIRACPFKCENGGIFDDQFKKCNCPEGFFGLCCQKESNIGICGDVLLTPDGEILSPGLDKGFSYPPNLRCVWKIIADPERRIALSVKDDTFNIQQIPLNGNSCTNDKLEIFDGDSRDGIRIGSYCGNAMRKLETVYSTGNSLYLEFVSGADIINAVRNFKLHFRTFLQGRECGPRNMFSLETGIITSPNYPINYKEQDKCEYEIQAIPNHDIIVEILEINMPARADCSVGDKITLLKKEANSEETEILTNFCGTEPHPKFTVKNPSSIILEFTSDSREGGTFKLRYNQVPSTASTVATSS